ncbi:MAG: VWA domain-containing protein [Verrucomicrobiota bacterium]
MSFLHPQLLWLLALPLLLLARDIARRAPANARPDKILAADAGPGGVSLTPSGRARRARVRWRLALGLALAALAVARPQWGRIEEPVFDQAREILVAIDLSRSMLADDVKPNRLERARLLTQSLLENTPGERVGLVVFSGTAFLQSPLSGDHEIIRDFLPLLDPGFLPAGGTDYTALLQTSLGAFSDSSADRFLVILSDGEAANDDWRELTKTCRERGVRILTLGIGTTAGAMLPRRPGRTRQRRTRRRRALPA